MGQRINPIDRRLQCGRDVRVCRLVKTDVTIADLDKTETRAFDGALATAFIEGMRYRNSAAHGPDQSGARPRHAL